jgi:hypothetical protein
MKLEKNMYVRTNEGYIAKLVGFTQTFNQDGEYDVAYIFDKKIDYYNTDITWYYLEKIMKKASHNIIDLIEVGDYVNGDKVIYTNDGYIEVGEESDNIGFTSDKFIKSIVTKEQFESMSYKVQ